MNVLTNQQLIQQDTEHLIHPLHHQGMHSNGLVWVRGKGAILEDADGKEYLDGLAGLWNNTAGHGQQTLVDAASQQMATLPYASGYTGSTNPKAIELAERLSEMMYPKINHFFFTSGGGESSDSNFKMARYYWKLKGKPEKTKVISRQWGYHGVTLAAMCATGISSYWPMFEPRIPGFGRTGTLFGLQHWGIEPDMIQFAKAITSGYFPLGGIGISDEIHQTMTDSGTPWMHAYTYSSHPVGCAVALAMLDLIEKEDFPTQAREKGARLLKNLKEALEDHPNVGDVRGLGMMCGIEIVKDKATGEEFDASEKIGPKVHQAGVERGLFSRVRGDVYCLAPPIITTESQLDQIVEILKDSITEVLG